MVNDTVDVLDEQGDVFRGHDALKSIGMLEQLNDDWDHLLADALARLSALLILHILCL